MKYGYIMQVCGQYWLSYPILTIPGSQVKDITFHRCSTRVRLLHMARSVARGCDTAGTFAWKCLAFLANLQVTPQSIYMRAEAGA